MREADEEIRDQHARGEFDEGDPNEIRSVRGRLRLPIERDAHWKAKKKLTEYAKDGKVFGIVKGT